MAKKSVIKRIRVTKTGKLIRRRMAQDHFRAGKSGKVILEKRDALRISESDKRRITQYLSR